MRFLLDAMLGRVATYLRICGHDAAYALDRGVECDDRLLDLAAREERRLVARNVGLAARAGDANRPLRPRDRGALAEFRAAGVDLSLGDRPPRCSACNGELEPTDGAPDHAPDGADVGRYRGCGQRFWRGSHWMDVERRLEALDP